MLIDFENAVWLVAGDGILIIATFTLAGSVLLAVLHIVQAATWPDE